MLSLLLLSMLMILLSILSLVRDLMWRQLELASESDPPCTVDWGRKWVVDLNAGKTQLVWSNRSNNTGATEVKIDGSTLEKNDLLRCWGCLSKSDRGSYIIYTAKTVSQKIGALIRSMKFLSPEVALYLHKSTIRTCMEYCSHFWTGASSYLLELLDELQKRTCRTVGPLLAVYLEHFAYRQNVARLSLFYRYYLGRCSSECSSELVQLVPLTYSRGSSIRHSDRLRDFSVTIPICLQGFYFNSLLPRKATILVIFGDFLMF